MALAPAYREVALGFAGRGHEHARTHARTASSVRNARPSRGAPSEGAGDGSSPTVQPPARRLLIVEDDEAVFRMVARVLRRRRWAPEHAASASAAVARLDDHFDAVLVDLDLGDGGRGERVLEALAARQRPTATVVVSGCGTPRIGNDLGLAGIPFLDKLTGIDALASTLEGEVEVVRLVTGRGLVGSVARSEMRLLREIVAALRATGGNQSAAADRLGIPRTTLRDWMHAYGLRREAFRPPRG